MWRLFQHGKNLLCRIKSKENCLRPYFCRVECQKLGEDLQQAYRAANQALEEIPAFEDIPKVDSNAVKELAEGTGEQAVSAFRNSRGAAGTTSESMDSDPEEESRDASQNGSGPSTSRQSESEPSYSRQSGEDAAASKWEEGVNMAASKGRSAIQQVATAAREEVSSICQLSHHPPSRLHCPSKAELWLSLELTFLRSVLERVQGLYMV